MNKKSCKLVSYYILILFLFISLMPNVEAAAKYTINHVAASGKYGYNYFCIPSKPLSLDSNCVAKYNYKIGGKSLNYNKGLRAWAFYAVDSKGKAMQTFCIEQNVDLSGGYKVEAEEKNNEWNFPKQELASQAISNALYYGSDEKDKLINKLKASDSAKSIATQELIWEIARGERTGFSIKNDCAPKSKCDKNTCPFYTLIKNKVKVNGKDTYLFKPILDYYKKIVTDTYYTYYAIPDNFNPDQKATSNPVKMSYKNNKFVVTLNAKKIPTVYKYFTYSSSNDDVKVASSNDGNTLTITGAKPLTGNIKITAQSKKSPVENDKFMFFHDDNKQDVIAVNAAKPSIYSLYVYTPKSKITVKKLDASNKKTPMGGIEFNVYSGTTCQGKPIASMTTGPNGIATYDQLPKPGDYSVKEAKFKDGYYHNTSCVRVSTSQTGIVYNYQTEFEVIKQIKDENGSFVQLEGECNLEVSGCKDSANNPPVFVITDANGKRLSFIKGSKNGEYIYSATSGKDTITELQTYGGKFKVYKLPAGNTYKVTEIHAPGNNTLPDPKSVTQSFTISKTKPKVIKPLTFQNGLTGLQFYKKNEDGEFVGGGIFAIQRKENNVYEDFCLLDGEKGSYKYNPNTKNTNCTIVTDEGITSIEGLPPGEYRVVEKEAPDGYEPIAEKDSKAIVTISDSSKDEEEYYLVEMINRKSVRDGSQASAELIVTIITGRKVLNYALIISGLVVLLVLAIVVRNKFKK